MKTILLLSLIVSLNVFGLCPVRSHEEKRRVISAYEKLIEVENAKVIKYSKELESIQLTAHFIAEDLPRIQEKLRLARETVDSLKKSLREAKKCKSYSKEEAREADLKLFKDKVAIRNARLIQAQEIREDLKPLIIEETRKYLRQYISEQLIRGIGIEPIINKDTTLDKFITQVTSYFNVKKSLTFDELRIDASELLEDYLLSKILINSDDLYLILFHYESTKGSLYGTILREIYKEFVVSTTKNFPEISVSFERDILFKNKYKDRRNLVDEGYVQVDVVSKGDKNNDRVWATSKYYISDINLYFTNSFVDKYEVSLVTDNYSTVKTMIYFEVPKTFDDGQFRIIEELEKYGIKIEVE